MTVGDFGTTGFFTLEGGVVTLGGKGALFEIGFFTRTGFLVGIVGVVFTTEGGVVVITVLGGVVVTVAVVLLGLVTLTSTLTHLPSKLLPLISPFGHISLANTFPAENQPFPATGAPALLFPPLPPPLLTTLLPPPHETGGVNQVAVTIT